MRVQKSRVQQGVQSQPRGAEMGYAGTGEFEGRVAPPQTNVIPGQPREMQHREASAMDDEVDVSVVIPCLNEERFIGKTLENLMNQYDHQRYEIIVVDGMSRDNTRQVVSEF